MILKWLLSVDKWPESVYYLIIPKQKGYKMILQPSPISSSKFTYSKETFTAEASDLRNIRLGKVYDDACDLGFTIVSEKTGKHAVFAEHAEIQNGEELGGWEFVCITPGLTHLKAVIFND